jgi:hypothetical protein
MRLCYDEKQDRRYAIVVKSRSQFFKKGQVIEEPTFNIFDEIINNMRDMKEVSGLSNKEENVFIDSDKNISPPIQKSAIPKLVSTSPVPPPQQKPTNKPTAPTQNPPEPPVPPDQKSVVPDTVPETITQPVLEEDFKVIANNAYNKLKSFRGKVDPVLIQKAAAVAPSNNFKNIVNIEQARAVEKAVNELEKFIQE